MGLRLPIWVVLILLVFLVASATQIEADPTDDFSLSLAKAERTESYVVMPESRVRAVFDARLPRFWKGQSARLSKHLLALCREYRFDPAFVLSLINAESGFKTGAVSSVGAVGLMQLLPRTAQALARRLRVRYPGDHVLMNPYLNLTLGVAYLAELRDHYSGLPNFYLLAAYNLGPARIDELLSRKSFRPVKTLQYYEKIRRGISEFRFYGSAPLSTGLFAHPL